MTTTESLAAWAARVAPTLDALGWLDVRHEVEQAKVEGRSAVKARALLAERDRVAAGLTAAEAAGLRSMIDGPEWSAWESLETLLLVDATPRCSFGCCEATDFGREIARVLAS